MLGGGRGSNSLLHNKHNKVIDLLCTLLQSCTLGAVNENVYRTAWVRLLSPRSLASLLSSYNDEYGELISPHVIVHTQNLASSGIFQYFYQTHIILNYLKATGLCHCIWSLPK